MTHPDTIVNGSDAFCQVRRGGEIRFLVRAADEDDDPLIYRSEAGSTVRSPHRNE